MKEEIYVVYCYYTIFNHDLPRRRWVKCRTREEAKEFVEKRLKGNNNKWLFAYVINGMEYEEIWL